MTPRLPALSESRPLRLTTVTAMYVAQGIQIGLVMTAFPAYLAAQGAAPTAIGGWMSAAVLPWTLKLLYSPLMERYTFLAMGRRRPWMIAGTVGGALGYVALALVPDPLAHFGLLTALMVAGSLFLALQDIATDALAIDIVPLGEQGRANGLMWGGKVFGTAGTAAAAAWLLGTVGVPGTFAAAAVGTAAFALLPLAVRERPGERLLPWTPGEPSPEAEALQLGGWADIGRSLRRVAFFPASLRIGASGVLLGIAAGFFVAFAPVFTVQGLGWTDRAFSNTMAIANLVGGGIGMIGGGLLVRRLGQTGAVRATALAVAAVSAGMGMAAPWWASPLAGQAFLILLSTAVTLMTIAFFATCMALCWKPVAAVQFALFMAATNVGQMGGSAAMGPLTEVLPDVEALFALAALFVAAALFTLRVDVAAHVERLEALDHEVMSEAVGTAPLPQAAF